MPQPTAGVRLSATCAILRGTGSPNSSTVPDVQRAGVGSLFLREDIGEAWICTTAAIPQSTSQSFVAAVWSELT
jgi:hypothetical protein